MKKTKVIAYDNLPAKLPIIPTAVAYLLLDKFNATDLVWGIGITVFSLIWIVMLTAIYKQKMVDVIKNDE